jgi:hypothetical protein
MSTDRFAFAAIIPTASFSAQSFRRTRGEGSESFLLRADEVIE